MAKLIFTCIIKAAQEKSIGKLTQEYTDAIKQKCIATFNLKCTDAIRKEYIGNFS